MLTLRLYTSTDYTSLNYLLEKSQAEFTASIATCIDERKDLEDINKKVVTIVELNSKEPIGFFILDTGDDKFALTDNQYSGLIRSFSINPSHQGKGYGKRAMQLAINFVRQNFPQINELVLSVNCRNIGAYQVYLKSGYIDTGKIIVGIAGEQNVLSKKIVAKRSQIKR